MKHEVKCVIHVCVHLRGENTPKYCVEVNCQTHKAIWNGLTNDWTDAGNMANQFPLVNGGLAYRLDAFPIYKQCIIANIIDMEWVNQ
jgi:hypothetical protein